MYSKCGLFYCYALGKVARLVDVETLADGYMVSEELQWDDGEQRSKWGKGVWNLDALVGNLRNLGIAFGDNGDDVTATRLDLLHVRHDLLILLVVSSHEENRHVVVDKGNRTVLHLGGRITFGMNIADFL